MTKRILAIFIDSFIVNLIITIMYSHFFWTNVNYAISYILSLSMFIFKDIVFKNKSIGKKIIGLEITTKNGQKPKFFILLLRNLFVIIWPVEFITLIMLKKTIGDIIFKTKVDFIEE